MIGNNGTSYEFNTTKTYFKDSNGKKIQKKELKVGDTIYVYNKKGRHTDMIPVQLPNVKYVKKIGSNLQNLNEYFSLISLENDTKCVLSDVEWIKILNIIRNREREVTINELPHDNEYKYIPKGILNYEYKEKNNLISEIILEIYENDIYYVENNYYLHIQTTTKIYNEKYTELKEILTNISKIAIYD